MNAPRERRVFAKFIDKPIHREDGRLVYSLLNAFAMANYRVALFETRDYHQVGPLGPMIYDIPSLDATANEPHNTSDALYVYDRRDPLCGRLPWRKKVRIKFDVFSNYAWASFRGREPILMPYPMHPWNYGGDLAGRLAAARGVEKTIRVFFSGDTKDYKRNRILYPRPKLTRVQVIEAILNSGLPTLLRIEDSRTLEDVLYGRHKECCAIVDMSKVFVGDWLNNLARAEFFICPPGYVMPMCHNAVEAMAVGTIPIISYPEWFRPSLRHLENCIAFDDEADLVAKINLALRMPPEDVARMRRNAIAYYERHLDPVGFVRTIEERNQDEITVMMITDLCTVNDHAKLNRNSFLIRDEPIDRRAGVGRLLSAMMRNRRPI